MPRLRQNEREQAVGMLLAGMAQIQIANLFNVSRMTIYRLMIRLMDTNNTPDRPHSGRLCVTTLPYVRTGTSDLFIYAIASL
jgi:transposase